MNLQEKLADEGVYLNSYTPGEYDTLCPRCSVERKPANRKKPVLSVKIDADGGAVWCCHHCGWQANIPTTNRNGTRQPIPRKAKPVMVKAVDYQPGEITPEVLLYFKGRGISEETLKRNQLSTVGDKIAYPYLEDGKVVNVKYRARDKEFTQEKNARQVLYGIDDIKDAKEVIICEGENDKLALNEAGLWNAVSVPNGAGGMKEGYDPQYLRNSLYALAGVERVILAGDADEPGEALQEALAGLLGRDKCWKVGWSRINDVPRKDAGEVLQHDGAEVLRECIKGAVKMPAADLSPGAAQRFVVQQFDGVDLVTSPDYLIKGMIPRHGLVLVWGPPKSGKSFVTFDMAFHIAQGAEYRGLQVNQGPVVYVACEGHGGLHKRVAALRQERNLGRASGLPFYLVAANLDLIAEERELTGAIAQALGEDRPSAVVVDTLNRSLRGSESSDEDMAAYVRAVGAIQAEFDCMVIVVHHCGVDNSRPRGHTSLSGAVDAQIAVKRDEDMVITARLEMTKDGEEGVEFHSALRVVEVGTDDDGETITSCVVESADPPDKRIAGLTAMQAKALEILKDAISQVGIETPAHIQPRTGSRIVRVVERGPLGEHLIKMGNCKTRQQVGDRLAKLMKARVVGTYEGHWWAKTIVSAPVSGG